MLISCFSPDGCKSSTISQRFPSPLPSSPITQQWIPLFSSFLLLQVGKLRQGLGRAGSNKCCGPGCSKGRLNPELSGLVQACLILPWGKGKDEVTSSCPSQSSSQWFEGPPSYFGNKALPSVTHKFLLVFPFMSY